MVHLVLVALTFGDLDDYVELHSRLPRRDNDVTPSPDARATALRAPCRRPGRGLDPVSQASLRGQVVTNRAGVTALVTLAMLNVVTLGAGVAVANMLPARLALWQVPRVAR